MSDLPKPLVAAEVDLRSFPYLPLDVMRLRDSDIAAVVSAEAFRAAVLLWCAAWHQLPAASLPSDDASLARLAGFGRDIAGWAAVREEALRGFVLCRDRRLYHGLIAEKANTAWVSKQARKAKTEAATAARKLQAEEQRRNVGRDDDRSDDRDGARDVHQQNVTEQNKEDICSPQRAPDCERSDKPSRPRRHVFPVDAFDRWYAAFPRKKARRDAEHAFRKIEAADAVPFAVLMAGIEAFRRENPDVAFWPYPASWLNGRRWEDEATSGQALAANGDGETRIDFGGGVRWPETVVRATVARWRSDPGTWPADRLGPAPGQDGCRVPEHLLRMAA